MVMVGFAAPRSINTVSVAVGNRDVPLLSRQLAMSSQKPSVSTAHEIDGATSASGGAFATRSVVTSWATVIANELADNTPELAGVVSSIFSGVFERLP